MPTSKNSSISKNFDQTSWQKAYSYALSLLNARDYSAARLHDKLITKGYEAAACQLVIQQLQSEGWINDLRFATRFAEYAISSGRYYGIRLRLEMKRKGFTEDVIANIFEQITEENHDNESTHIRNILERRYPDFSYKTASDKEKNRILGYLQRKGFGLTAILKEIKTYQLLNIQR